MAHNPVTPVLPVDRVHAPSMQRRLTGYLMHLEEWRMRSRLYASERRRREQGAMHSERFLIEGGEPAGNSVQGDAQCKKAYRER